ncbi:hypothetical protein HY212_02815 [Candidatus Pacearchaeota archaeon]|nr:hypothetical protein [Candidatus Pacearchaeota archaeon]
MQSAREHYLEVIAKMPELEQALEEAKARRARIDAGLESEPSEIVRYNRVASNDPGYFISVEAQLTKYAKIPQPISKDKKPSS